MNKLQIQFKEFDGPLDLLLSLVDEKKMEISEVSLSAVTEKFLDYIDQLEYVEAQELADFLVVATKLLLLKSRALLPQLMPDEDDGIDLEDQLKLYRRFVKASKQINAMWEDKFRVGYQRIESVRVSEEIVCPDNLIQDGLHVMIHTLVKRLAPPRALPRTHIDRTVSMKQKIDTLRGLLKKSKHVSFKSMLETSESKTEVIVSFLALLEMVKQKHVSLHQDDSFDDIVIKKV